MSSSGRRPAVMMMLILLYFDLGFVSFPGQSDSNSRQSCSAGHAARRAHRAPGRRRRGRRAAAPDADGRQAAGHAQEEARVPAVPEAAGSAESSGTPHTSYLNLFCVFHLFIVNTHQSADNHQ